MENGIKEVNGVLVIKPQVEYIDSTNALELKNFILEYVGKGKQKILIDLSEVAVIDSTGLGAVIAIYKAIKNQGTLLLCGLLA